MRRQDGPTRCRPFDRDMTETSASFTSAQDGTAFVLTVTGNWSVQHIVTLDNKLRALAPPEGRCDRLVIDLGGVTRLDTAGAWLLHRTAQAFVQAGIAADFKELTDKYDMLIREVGGYDHPALPKARGPSLYEEIVGEIGRNLVTAVQEVQGLLGFFGEVVRALGRALLRPRRLRLVPLMHHMERAGFDALPIVCLITFLIGGVLAQQGAVQLRRFGADIFTVNMVAITFLREIGILLTAIIVAGRSGSAFAAEIGSMKMREEIDAMRTLGLDPVELLMLPRVLALIITLPLLTYIADLVGLLGGGLVVWVMLDMSPGVYLIRLRDATVFWTFGVGLLKAPFMALVIALIGCYSGMKVTGSAESVGQQTTQAVVKSIFVVIILDALFAMFFTAVGI